MGPKRGGGNESPDHKMGPESVRKTTQLDTALPTSAQPCPQFGLAVKVGLTSLSVGGRVERVTGKPRIPRFTRR